MTKINRSICALLLVIAFCFSALPAYAAEVPNKTESTTTISAGATIFNAGNYMSGIGQHDVYNFTIPSTGKYTFTVIVDAMGGKGALVVLHRIGATDDAYNGVVTTSYQNNGTLIAGNYTLEVTSLNSLAYSVSIIN